MRNVCSVPGCSAHVEAHGLCNKHYLRKRTHGTEYWSPPTFEQRFWSRVEKSDGCWLWTGKPCGKGYGSLRSNNVRYYAHRASWIIHRGPIPPQMCVLHRCDNPPCVNPAHLFLGSLADNVRDMVEKGRQSSMPMPGEANGFSRFTDNDIREMRRQRKGGDLLATIARRFSTSQEYVSLIVKRKAWKHVEELNT